MQESRRPPFAGLRSALVQQPQTAWERLRSYRKEAGVSRSRSDQFDDRQVAGQWSCPPVLRNVGKEAVLDAVPLGCTWRVMAHAKRQAGFIGEFLQFQLPELLGLPLQPAFC